VKSNTDTLRILDAAANRASEGARIVEDYVRFGRDNSYLTQICKQWRHDLQSVLAELPNSERMAARETQRDVGTQITTAAEQCRTAVMDVVVASLNRVKQALRSLEEFSKIEFPQLASRVEQLRYAWYTVERAILVGADSEQRLAKAKLYVLIDGRANDDDFSAFATSLIAAGVHVLQLRDKSLNDRDLVRRGRILRKLTRGTDTLFIMNDRPDLAALTEADGVHVGQEELSVKDARTIVGTQALIGVSTHSVEQARQAVLDGANYIGVGPTFPSTTKQFSAFTGLELLRAVAAEIALPAFAIGGITFDNVAEVLATGIKRVAVSGVIAQAADTGRAVAEFAQRIG